MHRLNTPVFIARHMWSCVIDCVITCWRMIQVSLSFSHLFSCLHEGLLACLLYLTSPETLQLYHSGTVFASGEATSHILLCTNQPLSNHTRQPPDIQLGNYNMSIALTEIFMVLVIHWITRGRDINWTHGRVPHPPGSADIPV